MKKFKNITLEKIGSLQEGYTIEEIKQYEDENNILFPHDFSQFMTTTRNLGIDNTGEFLLRNEVLLKSPTMIFTIDWNDEYSWTKTIREVAYSEMEEMDYFFNFGVSLDSDADRYFIGVREPYIGKVYVWHFLNGDAEETATFDNERQIFVYPKIYICDTFTEFFEFIVNNQENFNNGIVAPFA